MNFTIRTKRHYQQEKIKELLLTQHIEGYKEDHSVNIFKPHKSYTTTENCSVPG